MRKVNDLMSTKNTPVLLSTLIFMPIASFDAADLAFGEATDEIKAKALEGKQIWGKIKDIENKEVKTEKDRQDKKELEKQFDAIKKEMNKHGIATQEQWDKNPDYWRMKNAPIAVTFHNESPPDNSKSLNIVDVFTTPSIYSQCHCPQEFRFITGFDYLLWGFWPNSALADSWKSPPVPRADMISGVLTKDDHSCITPFVMHGLAKAGSASINMEYSTDNPYGVELDKEKKAYSASMHLPGFHTVMHDEISNTAVGTDIQVIADLNPLSQFSLN